jgi:hypothetical protein
VKELESSHAAARDEWQVKLIEAEMRARKLADALETCMNALEDVEYQCSSTDKCPWCQSDSWEWCNRRRRNALRHKDDCQRQRAIDVAAKALDGTDTNAVVDRARKLAKLLVAAADQLLEEDEVLEEGVRLGVVELRPVEPGSRDAEMWGDNAELHYLSDWVRELAGGK